MWEWAESVWFQLISEWFHLISSDFSWFQCHSRFPFCEITLQCDSRFPFCGITHMWWFQISLLWNHTESPWITLNQPEITLNHTEIMLNQTEWFRVVTLVLKGNPNVNSHSFRSLHSLHSWWFSRTHLPTRWFQWFRKNHTRVSVWFPIVHLGVLLQTQNYYTETDDQVFLKLI